MKMDIIIEKKMESLFKMETGYVLDFSNSSIQAFIIKSVSINIYSDDENPFVSISKANRLRHLWDTEPDDIVAKLNIDLLEYWKLKATEAEFEKNKDIYHECMKFNKELLNAKIIISDSGISKKLNIEVLSHKYIAEQIKKTNKKIDEVDYSGAITNARSLVEQVLMELAGRLNPEIKNSGDLNKLYNLVAKEMNLQAANYSIDGFKQILSGLCSIISGLSNLRNELSDAHARKFDPTFHHARIAINSAHSICEFLLDSYEHQLKIKDKG